jgi:L-aspartate oxidase
VHPKAELAPRDIVARAVFSEIAAGRNAFLDCRKAIGDEFPERFPSVYSSCMSAGIDPARQLIPIAPAAHYHMGGISVDAHGHTSLDGLWAIGEVACTGVHGANRLASNSLLEAIVFAARAAQQVGGLPAGRNLPPFETVVAPPLPSTAARDRRLRGLMSAEVGVVRSGDRLALAMSELLRMEREAPTPGFRNMAVAALIVAAGAYARRESRGAHFRRDFPKPQVSGLYRTLMTLDEVRKIAETARAQLPAS